MRPVKARTVRLRPDQKIHFGDSLDIEFSKRLRVERIEPGKRGKR